MSHVLHFVNQKITPEQLLQQMVKEPVEMGITGAKDMLVVTIGSDGLLSGICTTNPSFEFMVSALEESKFSLIVGKINGGGEIPAG